MKISNFTPSSEALGQSFTADENEEEYDDEDLRMSDLSCGETKVYYKAALKALE